MKIRVLEGEVYTDLFTALGCNTSVVPHHRALHLPSLPGAWWRARTWASLYLVPQQVRGG